MHYEALMEARRYLRCLGQPALFSPTGEPIRFRTKKHLALLVYLAVEGRRAHRRERLAEFLWPKVSASEARHSLATALSILRPRLGPGAIESSRDHVLLNEGHLDLDLDRLMAGEILGSETQAPLEVGGFLEGFEIPDSGEFSLWKDREQARLLPRIMSAFSLLVDSCRRRGDSRQIEQLANRMLALDDLCEEAIRAKMEVLALAGDRLSALKVFEEWRTKLHEELSATPSDPMAAMAAQLRRRGWEGAQLSDLPRPPQDHCRGRTFVGRSAEYRILYEAWEDVRAGRRGHVLVLGDSGIGKTTLVERFTTSACLEGAIVSRVQCYDLDQEIPYAVIAGLVTGLLDRAEISGTPPEALAELSRIVPSVRQRFSSIPQPRDSHGETARIELTESFHQFLEALTEDRPVILVVDDLHLADDASLEVIHLLVRRALDQRVMLVLIARPGELTLARQGRRFGETAASLGIREVELPPLSECESSELLTCLVGESPIGLPLSVRKALVAAAAGFPMVIELLYQDWQASGGQSLGLALEAMTAELVPKREHTEAYHQLLNSIMRALDSVSRSVLQVASILGPRLNDLSMYGLADLSLGQTMTGLAQLAEIRVLRDNGRGLEFVNELLRVQVYAAVPSSVRRALHAAIADRLLGANSAIDHGSGLEVAWHCIRAGRPDQATPHLIRGARQAMRHGASHVAERALESALPAIGESQVPEVLLLLAEALQEQGKWQDSLDRLAALPAGVQEEPGRRAIVLAASARLRLGASLTEETRSQIPDLIMILRQSSDARTRVTAARVVAHFANADRDRQAAENLLPLVQDIPSAELDEDSQGQLALTRGYLLYAVGNAATSYDEVSNMSAVFQRRGTVNFVAVQLLIGLGTLQQHNGDYHQATMHYLRALEMAARLGNDTLIAAVAGNLALCYGRLGQYDEQLRVTLSAPKPWGAEFGGFIEIQLVYCQALAQLMQGKVDGALKAIAALDQRLHGLLPRWIMQAWLLWKADLLLCAGKSIEAHATGSRALQEFGFTLQSVGFAGPFARWLGHRGCAGENPDQAKVAIRQMVQHLDDYDALDGVEVASAALLLDATGDAMRDAVKEDLANRLLRLPPAVMSHLQMLGSLG